MMRKAQAAPRLAFAAFLVTLVAGARPSDSLASPQQSTDNLVVVSQTLATGVAGKPYHAALEASGGKPPYAWRLDATSTLPPGLQLDSSGKIDGVPTTNQSAFLSVVVSDSTTPTPQTATGFTSLAVNEPLHFTATTLQDAAQSMGYDYAIPLDGGIPPYTFRLVSGALPDGMSLPPTSANLAQFQGRPAKAGAFAFTLAASDAETPPATGQQAFTLRVNPRLVFQGPSPIPNATVGQPYSYRFEAVGGVAPLQWTLLVSTAPAGLTLDSKSGTLAGTPTQEFDDVLSVQVADASNPPQFVIASVAFRIVGASKGAPAGVRPSARSARDERPPVIAQRLNGSIIP